MRAATRTPFSACNVAMYAAVFLVIAGHAHALNRCVDAAGKVSYTDRLCPSSETQTRLRVDVAPDPPPRRVVAPPALQARPLPAPAPLPVEQTPPAAAVSMGTSNQPTCQRALRSYDVESSRRAPPASLRDLVRSRELAEQACGREVPMSAGESLAIAEEQGRRNSEAREAAAREAAAQAAHAAAQAPTISRISHCNEWTCFDQMGNRYHREIGSPGLRGPNGERCAAQVGGGLRCSGGR